MPTLEITAPGLSLPPVHLSMDKDYSATIGRSEAADICLPIGSVSSMHCTIVRVPGGYEVRDMGSTNGVIYRGQLLTQAPLPPGGEVLLGEASVQLLASDEEKAILEAEKAASGRQTPAQQPAAPAAPAADDDFVDLSDLNLEDDQPSDTVVPERETLISSAPQPETVHGIALPSTDPAHPEYGQLHYGATPDEDEQAPPSPRRYAPPAPKSNYPAMILYALIMFVLGIGTGVTYKYYSNTGELLPMVMMDIHSPKETLSQHKQQAQAELDRVKAIRDTDAQASSPEADE
ncbi:FHA domain-containing protein [Akkermansia sp. N21116]|uniref:FHA domain-containing protein n=1 Tax=Akkermansia sp. N21116 TaxID=3040764 RepID=UPI00244E66E7|nr:FHA domain-containing protein [Akkermansia sp. N21116]WPX41288.1 FHA domain-containing protein [Akkermansia sp. N21116]